MSKNGDTAIIEKHMEFSKLIIKRATWMFIVQGLLTLAVIYFRMDAAVHAVNLMTTTIPLYMVIFGGYFGKAGFENYQKIRCSEQQSEYDESLRG